MKVFIVSLFLGIHSDARLICSVDAAIGAGIVHFMGGGAIGVLVGSLIGASWGVFNYLIVTKLWLEPRGLVTLRA